MARETKAVTIDLGLWERLNEVSYTHRTPMVSLLSLLVGDSIKLLDAGALPDPDNLSMEGMRGWEDLRYEEARAVGRRKTPG